MKLTPWSREELLRELGQALADPEGPSGAAERDLVALCEEVSRRQLPVRIDCATSQDDRCHHCRRTLVVGDTAVAEWEDHFELEGVAPGSAAWAAQLSSSFPLPEAAASALGIVDACADPAACLDGRC